MVKAVIFDLDGLLIDSEILSYRICHKLLKPYGIDFSIADYAKNCSGKTAVSNVTFLIQKYQLPGGVQEGLEQVFAMEKELLAQGVDLKPGARQLLDALKTGSYQIAMASSSIEERALRILEQHGIREYFDAFVFGHEVTQGKPQPDIFLKACEKLGEAPKNCLVLEDSEAGIEAAYRAGIPVICIPDMKQPEEKYQRMLLQKLTSLQEVMDYLEKLK